MSMTFFDYAQLIAFFMILLTCGFALGKYMTYIYEGEPGNGWQGLKQIEQMTYKISGLDPKIEMTWITYSHCLMGFSLVSFIFVYSLQRWQILLPLNPESLQAVSADSSFNTAISFISNTNWQGYSGEVTLSYLTQMLGLTVQNFVSAAVGMSVLVALIRGIIRTQSITIGNFWSDLTRSIVHILLPLSVVLALVLVWQGAVQNFNSYVEFSPLKQASSKIRQKIAMGPAASQIAIKQLGTNGGGYFNVNSSHPFENPTPLSNFIENIAILLIPIGLCFTFGLMVKRLKEGVAFIYTMSTIFLVLLAIGLCSEFAGNPQLTLGSNMEGKETRFGITSSILWAACTTAASNGSVNCMHDSLTPMAGLVPMVLMQLGEIIYGGVGSGLYGMIVFALVAVFVAGLMVGRTPEYLGKKIEAFEMKMSTLVLLIPPFIVLIGTAIAVSCKDGTSSVFNPQLHGFSEILYAFSSAGNNNGSAFAGLNANTPFYNYALGFAMFIARYWLALPVLAIAGSLARKKSIPESNGTIPTSNPLFIAFLISIILIVGALTFIPALALGPIVEHLQMTFGAI